MRICALQLEVCSGNRPGNMDKAERMITAAMEAPQRPDVLVLPELWDVGYPDGLERLGDADGAAACAFLAGQARRFLVNVVGGSIARDQNGALWNTAYVFDRQGSLLAAYDKIHLFSLTGEHNVFSAGDRLATFSLDGQPAGLVICYDIRFGELVRGLAHSGIKLLFVPALWAYPRVEHWKLLVRARALEHQLYAVGVNACGTNGQLTFCGHSLIVDPWGEVLACSDDREGLISAECSMERVDAVRDTITVHRDSRPAVYRTFPSDLPI